MIQRRAARFVTSTYSRRSSVTALLTQLHWQTLHDRRAHSKVTMLYRIHHQLVSIPATPPYLIYTNHPTRGHRLMLQQHHCRIDSYKYSFFPSVVNLWNKLPSNTVEAESTRPPHTTLIIWTMFYQHFTIHCFINFTPILLDFIEHVIFIHGPNTSASAQYDRVVYLNGKKTSAFFSLLYLHNFY